MKKNLTLKVLIATMGLSALTNLNAQSCDENKIIFEQDFSAYDNANKAYTTTLAKSDFGSISARASGEMRGLSSKFPQKNRVINGELRAHFTPNDASARTGGFVFDKSFTGVDQATLEYRVKFADNFVFATGGKLPGLGGASTAKGNMPAGCTTNKSVNENAFSCRLMWRSNTKQTRDPYLILYDYLPNRKSKCGGSDELGNLKLKKGRWYKIRQYLKLNTPGKKNGIVRIYVDDKLLLEKENVVFRLNGKSKVKINAVVMHVYRGGNRTDKWWQSKQNDHMFFDDFKVWTNCFGDYSSGSESNTDNNVKPTVSITSPTNNSTHEIGKAITLTANASDSDGNLEKINFKINDDFYKTDSERPFTTTFKPEKAGTYKISAKAFDKEGLSQEKTVTITVKEPAPVNKAPTVTITSPANNSTIELGQTINLTADASDSNGNLDKVNFKINDDFYKTDSERPFTTTFKPDKEGTYKIAARAFDKEGLSEEKSVTITVKAPAPINQIPTVEVTSPVNESIIELGKTITLSAIANDPENNLDKVNFKINDIYYKTSSKAPFETTYTPKQTGSFIIAARAYDKEGLSEEKSVTITVIQPENNNTNNSDSNCDFGAPLNDALPSFDNASFDNIHLVGKEGADVSQVTRFRIDWDASTNKLNQFAINTEDGVPSFYIDLLEKSTFNFNAAYPEITLKNTGLNGWDGNYWVTNDGDNFVLVSKDNDFSIYFNNGEAPVCETLSQRDFFSESNFSEIKVYPTPATNNISLKGITKNTKVSIIDISGRPLLSKNVNENNSQIQISELANGVYFLKIHNNKNPKTISFIKN